MDESSGMMNTLRGLLSRLTPFEKRVADRAAEEILEEMEKPANRRRAAQERERKRLVNSGVHPKDASELAQEGGGRRSWFSRGTRERRAKRRGEWF